MGAPVFALTGYAVASHVIPRGFAYRCVVWLGAQESYRKGMQGSLMAAGYAVCEGVTLESDLSDKSNVSDKMGAPVFALTGYAVASHVIPRGFAYRCVVGLGAKSCRWGMRAT